MSVRKLETSKEMTVEKGRRMSYVYMDCCWEWMLDSNSVM